jgi:hypothetical protein
MRKWLLCGSGRVILLKRSQNSHPSKKSAATIPAMVQLTCPNHHLMVHGQWTTVRCCDLCGDECIRGSNLHRCIRCNWDICEACAVAPTPSSNHPSTAQRRQSEFVTAGTSFGREVVREVKREAAKEVVSQVFEFFEYFVN